MRILKYVIIFPIKAPSGHDQAQHLHNDTGLIELDSHKERDQTQVNASEIQKIVIFSQSVCTSACKCAFTCP